MPKYVLKFNPFLGDVLLQEEASTETIISSGGVFEAIPMTASIVYPETDFPTIGGAAQPYAQTAVKNTDNFTIRAVIDSGFTAADVFLYEQAN